METKSTKIKLSLKLILPVVSILAIAGVLVLIVVNRSVKDRIEGDLLKHGKRMQHQFQAGIDGVSRSALHIAIAFSVSDDVIQAYRIPNEAEGRAFLRSKISPILEQISSVSERGIRIQFHKAPAVSFLRTWRKPGDGDGGDDLSAFRNTILKVAQTKAAVSGLETGKGGTFLRGIAPIFDNQKYVGSAEYFFDMHELIDYIGLAKNENLYVFVKKEFASLSRDSKDKLKIGNYLLDASSSKSTIDSTAIYNALENGDSKFFMSHNDSLEIATFPLIDFSGQNIGVVLYTTNVRSIIKEAKTSSNSIVITIILALFFIIISVLFTIYMYISRPLKQISQFLNSTATGDLSAELKFTSNDEMGALAGLLKETFANVKTVFGSTKRISDSLNHASKYLNSSSQQVAQGASEQAASVEEVSASMEEMSANIEQNADNAATTEKEVYLAAAAVYEGNKSVQKTAELMNSIQDKATTINEIAKQTNILALNASVEAANAGEFGEGFAVIAREIRTLAETSRKAAIEIRETIQQGVEIADKSGNQLSEIVKKMEKSSEMIRQIVTSSREQKNGVDQVVGGIQQLNKVTQQNAAIAEELATNAEQLAGQSEKLSQMLRSFKTGDEQAEHQHSHKSHNDNEIESFKQNEIGSENSVHTNTKKTDDGYSFELSSDMHTDDSDFELY